MTAGLVLAVGVLLIFLLGVAQRIGWIDAGGGSTTADESAAETIYTCPMHPQIRQPGEGRCPICGMALVPASAGGGTVDETAVMIEPAQRRLANIQTATVREEPVVKQLRTIGAIQIDESRQATIAAYVDGRVERLFADYTGVVVDKGDHLAVIYSPQLYSAQVEYLQSSRTFRQMTDSTLASVRQVQEKMVTNSRQKLIELGMTNEQLAELESSGNAQSRLTIYSPIGGTVTDKLVQDGQYITAGEPIYRIAELSTVWLMLELYPEDAARMRFGQQVEAELPSLPGQKRTGRVAFIDPTVAASTRTVGVRVELRNDDGKLRPGDYAQATINVPIGPRNEVYDEGLAGKWISPMHPQVIRDEPGDCPICGMKLVPTSRYGYSDTPVERPLAITVPRSAVLMAGDHAVVYVETEPGRFELRDIELGPILRDQVVVLSGVKPGEEVATAGNFLIDSQMQLEGKPSLLDPTKATGGGQPKYRNTPLEFDSVPMEELAEPAGTKLEELYAAYFRIQQTLGADEQPAAPDAQSLAKLAGELASTEALTAEDRKRLGNIAEQAAHLHHMELKAARLAFKPISHDVLYLATRLRGADAEQPYYHFFCPMVPQGEGDWLQDNDRLINPYFGSEMLRCGELVHTLDPDASSPSEVDEQEQPGDAVQQNEKGA
ncbi:MAG: efflux RND transporter periplasmic adaptor subunit [Pirellulales bacterium]